MRKRIWTLCILLIISLIFASGCEEDSPKIDEKVDNQVRNAAYHLLEERFETFPENAAVMSYEIDPVENFQVMDVKDEKEGMYVVRGGYQCIYGWSEEKPILEMSVDADFLVKQSSEGSWSMESVMPVTIQSDADSKGEGWITSIDESSSVFFISIEDVNDKAMEIPAIASQLIGEFMMKFSDYESEKATFMLAQASSQASGIEQIEIPKGRNDIKVCWKIKDAIVGTYLGYMEGLGYAVPMLQEDFENESITLNQEPLYLVKKQDGFYLESAAVFEGKVKGQVCRS